MTENNYANLDILDAKNWGAGFHERFRWLRENDPVYWDAKNEIWAISKHADVSYASKHHEIFCSGEGTRPNMPTKLSIVDMDEPRHGQLRNLINRGFKPRTVAMIEQRFRQFTIEAIEKVRRQGTCDFVRDIAVPMPIEVIADLIGIPKTDREKLHHWSDTMIMSDGNYDNPEIMMRAADAFAEYVAYIESTIEARRKDPQEDLVSILVNARDGGMLGADSAVDHAKMPSDHAAEMAKDELTMFLVTLLIAGNETTRNALTGGMSQLIENPGERQKLIDNPALIPTCVEEIVRHVSPVLNFARTATQDTELRGKKIKKGEKILLMYPSANRDADVFENPDAFIADRNPNPHLAFGIGNHFCLGANLARMEIRVVLEEVLTRMPNMEYTDGPPSVHPSLLVRSFTRMPVRFTSA
jgi:cytochrome P450 family 142 subfamily A polypeptide 1